MIYVALVLITVVIAGTWRVVAREVRRRRDYEPQPWEFLTWDAYADARDAWTARAIARRK